MDTDAPILITLSHMRRPSFFEDAAEKGDDVVICMLWVCMYCHETGAHGIVIDSNRCVHFVRKLPRNNWKMLE